MCMKSVRDYQAVFSIIDILAILCHFMPFSVILRHLAWHKIFYTSKKTTMGITPQHKIFTITLSSKSLLCWPRGVHSRFLTWERLESCPAVIGQQMLFPC